MPRRLVAFVALALVLAALFVRLGFWQLSRLEERRARNAEIGQRLALPATPFAEVGAGESHRRVTVEGDPDFGNEIVHTGRSRNGSPGVHIYTPLRIPGRDTAVLVNRGWMYAPDAATVDLTRASESRTRFHGVTLRLPEAPGGADAQTSSARALRQLNQATVRRVVPYPVAEVFILALDSTEAGIPARLPAPELTEGPHLGYAIQWFAFALIAVGGAGIVVHRARKGLRTGSTAAMEG